MRPLQLSLTAFGPYAGTEHVDFGALTHLGLFVVAGPTGAGKTSIFDGLHYALYGALPGRRAGYARLRSDHAPPGRQCSVTLDFLAQGTQWRVTRTPKQPRPKKRGSGMTEAPPTATLFRFRGDQPVAVTNRLDEVRDRCAELVGLTGPQFERVALLPQGEFSRVLSESGTARRELLRTLFSSDLFADATTLLVDQAEAAGSEGRAALDRLDHRRAELVDQLCELTAVSVDADARGVKHAIGAHRRGPVRALHDRVQELAEVTARAHDALIEARQISEGQKLRAELLERQEQFAASAADHERDLLRLERARAAVPVVSTLRTLQEHQGRLESIDESLGRTSAELTRALAAAGLDPILPRETNVAAAVAQPDDAAPLAAARLVDRGEQLEQLGRQLGDRVAAGATHADAAAVVDRLQAAMDAHRRQLEQQDVERAQATAALESTAAELAALDSAPGPEQAGHALAQAQAVQERRHTLAQAEADANRLGASLRELDERLHDLDSRRTHADETRTQLPSLEAAVHAALDHVRAAEQNRLDADRFHTLTQDLAEARQELRRADDNAGRTWDRFIGGTAARLAETLEPEAPCPVCGSAEHPEPALAIDPDIVATDQDVSQTRAIAEEARRRVGTLESEIEALTARHVDLPSADRVELSAAVTTARAMLIGAEASLGAVQRSACEHHDLTEHAAAARGERETVNAELRTVENRCSELRGALGEHAHDTLESVDAAVERCREHYESARHIEEQRSALTARHTELEHDLATIAANRIATENRLQMTVQQHGEARIRSAEAEQRVTDLDSELASTMSADIVAEGRYEHRIRAVRRASELVRSAAKAMAGRAEVATAVRRAQSIVNDRLRASPFESMDDARAAFMDDGVVRQLEAQTAARISAEQQLVGRLHSLEDLPAQPPGLDELQRAHEQAAREHRTADRALIATTTELDRIEHDLAAVNAERDRVVANDSDTRRLERVAGLVKGDNDRNTSLENWVLAAHLRDVVELANVRLAQSTRQRFQLCVLDDGENRRGRWGLDLGVEDTVTGTRRPTAGLSGGELFQASLALALGLADAVMNQSAGVHVDALFIDEGFGSLDESSVDRAIDLLDGLRDRGALVGVITHVPALLDALPVGIRVAAATSDPGSTIHQQRHAA